jgi:hypothetical protein
LVAWERLAPLVSVTNSSGSGTQLGTFDSLGPRTWWERAIDPAQGRLLTLRRRVLSDVDHVLDAVIDVPLARFQRGGVRLADHCLGEARLTLINHEVSRGPLLAPENLALQHPLSISDSQMKLLAWMAMSTAMKYDEPGLLSRCKDEAEH